ncbi:MAG TPA: hypothetical protein VI072_31190 [Polyangiaceae bacterium]
MAMKTRSFVALAALVGAAATLAVPACSSKGDSHSPDKSAKSAKKEATVNFAIDIGGGIIVDSVEVDIDNEGDRDPPAVDATTTIDVSQPGSTISAELGVPLGSGYIAYLSASSADGGISCTGQSDPFSVTSTTEDVLVGVTLTCRNSATGEEWGGVVINADASVQTTICPAVNAYTVSPLQVNVGGTITLTAAASGTGATYRWSEGATTIPTTDGDGTYTCASAGAHTLTLTVGSSTEASCSSVKTAVVTCVAPSGTGGTGGGAGEGGTAGTAGSAGEGGTAGTAGSAGEGGTAGTAGTGGTGGGTNACLTCDSEQCTADVGARPCSDFTDPAQRASCEATLACARRTNCATEQVVDCYCGPNNPACLTGGANGACKTEIETAIGSTDPNEITINLIDTTRPGGAAMFQVLCNREACFDACFPYPTP